MIGLHVEKAGNKHWVCIFSLIPLFPLCALKMQPPDPENPGIYKCKCCNSLSSLPEVFKRNSYSNRVLMLGNRIASEKKHSPIIHPWGVGLNWHIDIFMKSCLRDLNHPQTPRSFIYLTQQSKFNRWILYIGYFCCRMTERSEIWTSWRDFETGIQMNKGEECIVETRGCN